MHVAIEIMHDNPRAAFDKSLENRTLVHTVAAPGAGQAKDFHLAHKAVKHFALLKGQLHSLVNGRPAATMVFVAMSGQEIVVTQAVGKLRSEIKHGRPRLQLKNASFKTPFRSVLHPI